MLSPDEYSRLQSDKQVEYIKTMLNKAIQKAIQEFFKKHSIAIVIATITDKLHLTSGAVQQFLSKAEGTAIEAAEKARCEFLRKYCYSTSMYPLEVEVSNLRVI